MFSSNPISAVITGVGHYLPNKQITSEAIELQANEKNANLKLPKGFIKRVTGIQSRHYVDDSELPSDLAAKAGAMALKNANLEASSVDVLIFASASHDISYPATANIVQTKMGCTTAHVIDIKNACNGFLNALDTGSAYIQTGRAKCVLVVVGEVLSPLVNWHIEDSQELSTKFAGLTLGDGGGACVLTASDEPNKGILPGGFFSDGNQWECSTILSGGILLHDDCSKNWFESHSVRLHELAIKHIPPLVFDTLNRYGWSPKDLNLVVPHQTSLRLIEQLCEILDYPISQCALEIENVGNTASATIPITLSMAVEANRISKGDKLLFIGGASGFSSAVIPVVW